MNPEMIARYKNFLCSVYEKCSNGVKITPSVEMSESKVSAYAFRVLLDLGYVKDMEPGKAGARHMVWVPSDIPTNKQVTKVYATVKEIDSAAKRKQSKAKLHAVVKPTKAPTQVTGSASRQDNPVTDVNVESLKKATVTIGNTTLKIPVYGQQVDIVVNGTPITISL